MDMQPYTEERGGADTLLKQGMSFLAENPEAFGLITDACPAVTSELLVAANGHSTTGGAVSPTYSVEGSDAEGLFDALFEGLLPRTDDYLRLLRATFGEGEGMQEHPVARYCAALAEGVALRVMTGSAKGASPEQTCAILGDEIPRALARLREKLCVDGLTAQDAVFYTVSFGACRVAEHGGGSYTIDIFSAGDFRVFLLDGEGMHPLWMTDTPVLSSDTSAAPRAKRLTVHHPEPFAVLLLSDSVCSVNAAEHRALRESPGLIWRYRMRLEDYFLRVITSCVREQEFGERAARFFTGRSRGRDSASGGMMILRGSTSYEVFRATCQIRLAHLEDMMGLMPEGYDPDNVTQLPPRADMERSRLRHLLEQETGLSDRVSEALRLCALEKLQRGAPAQADSLPEDVPAYRRLGFDEVWTAFRRYDADNDADRARVTENRRILRENLIDQWMTLRPHFLKVGAVTVTPCESCARSYAACADMNARLGHRLAARRRVLSKLEELLSDSLDVLHAEGGDWLAGRAGDGGISAWANRLHDCLPNALTPLLADWQAETDRYRSLLAAYTYEREQLFCLDTHAPDGFFAADWQGITDGTLPDERWHELTESLNAPDRMPYRELMESLHRVSDGTGALLSRIQGRGAKRRMARDVANRTDLQIEALRASAYEDADWGDAVVSLMNPTMRREHHTAVRHWQETQELLSRRATAYAEFSAAYRRYIEDAP